MGLHIVFGGAHPRRRPEYRPLRHIHGACQARRRHGPNLRLHEACHSGSRFPHDSSRRRNPSFRPALAAVRLRGRPLRCVVHPLARRTSAPVDVRRLAPSSRFASTSSISRHAHSLLNHDGRRRASKSVVTNERPCPSARSQHYDRARSLTTWQRACDEARAATRLRVIHEHALVTPPWAAYASLGAALRRLARAQPICPVVRKLCRWLTKMISPTAFGDTADLRLGPTRLTREGYTRGFLRSCATTAEVARIPPNP